MRQTRPSPLVGFYSSTGAQILQRDLIWERRSMAVKSNSGAVAGSGISEERDVGSDAQLATHMDSRRNSPGVKARQGQIGIWDSKG